MTAGVRRSLPIRNKPTAAGTLTRRGKADDRHQQRAVPTNYLPQHCLYFLPLWQGHGSLRPTLGPVRTGLALAWASAALAASLTRLPACWLDCWAGGGVGNALGAF